MALTDAQWAAVQVDVNVRLIAGAITEAQAVAELTEATEDWPTRSLSNADLALRVSKVLANLGGLIETEGPPSMDVGAPGAKAFDSVNFAFYGPKTAESWGAPRSLVGVPGPAGVITDVTLTMGAPGSEPSVALGGTPEAREIGLTVPAAVDGVTPNVSAAVTMIAPGQPALVTRSGPDSAPVFTFQLPRAADGSPGREVEMQGGATHLQWRYVGDADWINLFARADFKGDKGDQGEAFDFDAKPADLAARATYDAEDAGFTVLVMDTGTVYARIGATPGVWSDGFPFGQSQNAILEALSALSATPGLLYQVDADTFEKRAIGVASDADVPDRQAGDGRWRRQGVAVPMADVADLADALAEKSDAAATLVLLGGKEDKAAKGAANGYAGLGADGKVPAGQLPATSGGGLEVGDILTTARAPGAKYLLADGSTYLRTAWPALSPLMPDGTLPLTGFTAGAMPVSALWGSVVFGAGLFVSVVGGAASAIYATSPDGINWTQRALPLAKSWNNVAFGNGIFVIVEAVTGAAKCLTSPDGINWTERTLPSRMTWNRIAFGNGRFVLTAAGSSRTEAISTSDCINWTDGSLPSAQEWPVLAFGGGLFLAIATGASGSTVAATSTDGISWTARTMPSQSQWGSAVYGAGRWVAFSATTASATSADGITWGARVIPVSGSWFGCVFAAGLFVFTGLGTATYLTSPDGVTWTQRSMPSSQSWGRIAFGAGRFVTLLYAASSLMAYSNSLLNADTFQVPAISGDLAKAYIKGEA